MKKIEEILKPSDWGLSTGKNNELILYDFRLIDFAEMYGTPLYVLDEKRLTDKTAAFKSSAANSYSGKVSVHYPFKCNSTPAVAGLVKSSGLKAEVMTEFELNLALSLGFDGKEIIVNGPCKTDTFLQQCLDAGVKLISVDSIDELKSLSAISANQNKKVDILLRINPDYIPEGLPLGSATGSRKSVFGLSIRGNEINEALDLIRKNENISFQGIHFHIGTGISRPEDYNKVIIKLIPLFNYLAVEGFKINILDVGGGYPSPGTRELKTYELIAARFLKYFQYKSLLNHYSIDDFTKSIGDAVSFAFHSDKLPELIYEPGRSIVSSCQLLLLKVQRTKGQSPHKWLITDGGLGTITLPTYYEFHKVFLANDVQRPCEEYVTITGPCCFAGDIIYKNILMPRINQGEILAIMDTGAYFNGFESNFGFARPAIISVSENQFGVIREKETYEDMVRRDITIRNYQTKR